jgi:preprotein translocase, secY subunit
MKWLKTKRVRNRILFTLFIILLFEIGTFIPLPYVEHTQSQSEFGSLLNLVSGGALSRFGLFALGCSPFISASIVTQLWTIGFPSWERLAKQGKEGQSIIYRRTQIIAVFLAVLQSYGIIVSETIQSQLGLNITTNNIYQTVYLIMLTVVGTLIVSYLCGRINEKGIGQGQSIIIAVGILGNIPSIVISFMNAYRYYSSINDITSYWKQFVVVIGVLLLVIILCIVANKKVFKLPIHSENNSHYIEAHYFPIKLLASSVMPVIFASMIISVLKIISDFKNLNWTWTSYTTKKGFVVYILVILLMTFIYNSVEVNGDTLQEDLTKGSMYLLGVRPTESSKVIKKKLFRINLIGAPVLALIAGLSLAVNVFTPIQLGSSINGLSVLILVGVLQEVIYQINGLTQKTNYKELF